ncbi:unnamed protein product [Amoebophrya sp. A120]|nr:unnamed protein product [Amoebophrya sp. A120]|eukprot:GSA120T00017523001.1
MRVFTALVVGAVAVQAEPLLKKKPASQELAKEMTRDLEMNFNKIAPFGKEDTAKELQDHAAKTQDTLVDAVENAEVAEIKRAVFRALTRLRAASIKEFDTIARLETQAIDAYNDAHHYRAENPYGGELCKFREEGRSSGFPVVKERSSWHFWCTIKFEFLGVGPSRLPRITRLLQSVGFEYMTFFLLAV